MSSPLADDLTAAFTLAYADAAETTRDGARCILDRLVAHLDHAGLADVSDVDADTLNRWVATATEARTTHHASVARRTLRALDPDLLHPSLLVDGQLDWSPHRPTSAVALAREGRRTWVDPAAYPNVRAVADTITGLLARVPDHYSGSYADEFGRALRSLLGWLDTCPAPPARLHWLTADLLDGWVAWLKDDGTANRARSYGSRVRDLLANRPHGMPLHGSLLAADGATVIWEPDATATVQASDDLPFSTLAAVHHAARDQVRRAVARITTVDRAARGGVPADRGGDWDQPGDVWRVALDGRLDRDLLTASLGDDPDGWPGWLTDLLPDTKPPKRPWVAVAVAAIHEHVFPTALEVAGGYVLMLLATGLPPESVMALERRWFLAARRPDGGYGPVCRLRYPKDRAGGPTQARLYTTRTAASPLRVRDLVDRMTAGLRQLTGDPAGRLWLVLAPKPLRYGRPAEVTTLDQISLQHPYRRGGAGAFTVWVATHGLDDPGAVAAWNDARQMAHDRRVARHQQRAAARGPLVGLLGPAPFRPYTVWPGRVAPQRLRKTLRVRDLVLHGPDGAARDHTTLTLLKHYTASEALQVVAATAVRDAQATLEAFAADPAPRLLTAGPDTPAATVAAALGIDVADADRLLGDGARRMRNGLVCATPTDPPDGHEFGDDGWCRQLGTTVWTTCPAAVAVPDGTGELWDELRRADRTAHITDDSPAVTRTAQTRRQTLLDVLALLDPDGHATYQATGHTPDGDTPGEVPAPPRRRRRA